jgi:hypothetical protein
MTGFQRGPRSLTDLETLFKEIIKSDDKTIEFQRFTLRSAKRILKDGGHVTPIYSDQKFRLLYDNMRLITTEDENIDLSEEMLESKPHKDISECKQIRDISSLNKKIVYYRTLHKKSPGVGVYKNKLELAVRTFIKGIFKGRYNLNQYSDKFKSYKSIKEFIETYDKSIKLTDPMISNYKNRKMIFKSVPKDPSTLSFRNYVKTELPDFDDVEFFE